MSVAPGGHPIKLGLSRYIIDLIERGLITHVATNGAGIIHDFELALVGGTSEDVARWINVGQFGLWQETSRLNDIISEAAKRNEGLGEAVGRVIEESVLLPQGGRDEIGAAELSEAADVLTIGGGYLIGKSISFNSGIMHTVIRPENRHDKAAIRHVNRAAFEGDTEATLVDALRAERFVEASLVAEVDGTIVGHILFSRVNIVTENGTWAALSLAPMAVLPNHQRQGIGSRLVAAGLTACRDAGHKIVLVLGHARYYPRFGFSSELAQRLESPFGGGASWMALELIPGALDEVAGRVEFSPPFAGLM